MSDLVPANIEAERQVLGALLVAGALGPDAAASTLARVRAAGLTPDDFYFVQRHGALFDAIETVAARGHPTEVLLVEEELRRRHLLEQVETPYLHELAVLAPAVTNIGYWAGLVVEASRRRRVLFASIQITREARDGGVTEETLEAIRVALAEVSPIGAPERLVPGDAFILDAPVDIAAVWGGASGTVTWAAGEGLMVVGPDGVGKTTLAQQLTLGAIGLRSRVLGMRVALADRPVLYLAMDRPAQVVRSFRRMVTEENRDVLRERLLVWKGPLPFNITESPSSLARFVREHGAGVLFVDSLKDVAVDLIKDEVGSRVNQAVQELLADGVEVCLLHHQRKQQAASGSPKPTRLADVYGSRWLTAGMGSVVLLWGDPGDLIVEFRHLKQPAEEVGPLTLVHDHDRGVTSVETQVDAFDLVRNAGAAGVTAEAAAEVMFTTEAPSRNEIEKARRRLEKLAEKGLVVREGERPQPVVYRRAQ